jgi:predicted SnoaL-like aldol condensation-catalyzing enzyme
MTPVTTEQSGTRKQSRTETAVAFLRMASTGDVRHAYEQYVSPAFRHHNAYFRGDAASLAAGMEQNASENPNKAFQVQRTIAEGDLVAIHSRLQLKPGAPEIAVVHIFRFDDGGRIVELWDVGQPVPPQSPNEFGMF